jgi:hypothetical protein
MSSFEKEKSLALLVVILGFELRALALAWQVFYHLSHTGSHFRMFYNWIISVLLLSF